MVAASPSPPTKGARCWTWTVISTWAVFPRTVGPRRCPLKSGRRLCAWVSWAVCVTSSWTVGVGTCGVWPSCRARRGSACPAHARRTAAAAPSPARTAATATKAGTVTSATAPGPGTWEPAVRPVRVRGFRSSGSFTRTQSHFLYGLGSISGSFLPSGGSWCKCKKWARAEKWSIIVYIHMTDVTLVGARGGLVYWVKW